MLHGKELSYNNILDLDSALNLVREFAEPAAVVIKHNNPCGAAVGATLEEAFRKAYEGDPLSAYGGVLGFNREVDEATAMQITEPNRFIECVIAPGYSDAALRDADDAADLEEERAPAAHRAARTRDAGAAARLPPRRRRPAGAGRATRGGDDFAELEGRDEAAADRGGAGRPALRLAGVQARQEQRHRAGARAAWWSASGPGR